MKAFVIEGDLWLWEQEGGFCQDGWMIMNGDDGIRLDDEIADYFGIERQPLDGDRHIGQVRITIERIGGEGD